VASKTDRPSALDGGARCGHGTILSRSAASAQVSLGAASQAHQVLAVAYSCTCRVDGSHRHAELLGKGETADAGFLEADAGIVMDCAAGASFGDKVGGIDGGMRAADDNGAIGFGLQLGHARHDEDGCGRDDIMSLMRV
jgi:hypothetical protein